MHRIVINGEEIADAKGPVKAHFEPGFILTNTQASPLAPLSVELTVDTETPLQLKLLQTAYDIPALFATMQPRTAAMMPEPFIVNDAVIISQRLL